MSAPNVGFPRMVDDDSELEGVYRFFGCEEIEAEEVLEPHIQATFGRMREVDGPVLVIHDTTDLKFGGLHHRKGLGRTHGNQQGFFLHLALAVVPGEERLALGACGALRLCRTSQKSKEKTNWYQRSQDPDRESLRWAQLMEQVELAGDGIEQIHVMDREGDNYDLLALAQRGNARFVVRACHNRNQADGEKLLASVEKLKPKAYRDIEVSERIDDGRRTGSKKHPSRRARQARVAVAGCSITLRRTASAHATEAELTVNVVRVWEPSPPKGEPPVSWLLYTTEPIKTAKQLLTIVDYYRSRWVIEEFFKALKTGCSIEKRQLESYHALSLALAVFIPVAWRMLLLRSVSRMIPNAPATSVATTRQLQLLRHKLKLKALPKTAEEVAYAVAKLGGHLKRNGPPGWLSLGRGFETLLLMEAGWKAAQAAGAVERSDQ